MTEEIDKDTEEETSEEEEKTEEDTDEETDEESSSDQSKESKKEPDTAGDAMRLAQNLQKGYTMTRQDMALIRENQEKIQEALEKLGRKDDLDEDQDEPLTVKKYLEMNERQRKAKESDDVRLNQRINRQLDELSVQGIIKTEEDKEALMAFAVKRKITNLSVAATQWKELQDAKKEGIKEGLKSKIKADTGSKVGTSQKTRTKEQGVDYGEIASKTIEELAEE